MYFEAYLLTVYNFFPLCLLLPEFPLHCCLYLHAWCCCSVSPRSAPESRPHTHTCHCVREAFGERVLLAPLWKHTCTHLSRGGRGNCCVCTYVHSYFNRSEIASSPFLLIDPPSFCPLSWGGMQWAMRPATQGNGALDTFLRRLWFF